MRIHFIAIGGAIMHNLAIALHKKGYHISGSDDAVFDPSRGRLESHGLLPLTMGWSADAIHADLDAVILGMHAKVDNPELLRAQELGVKVYSFPEFIYQQAKDKIRLVVAGSHGKTTTTAMIMHVLRKCDMDFDYMVGANVEGFEDSVKLTDAPIIILEGDEYLTSPIDRRPKFIWYKADHLMITGIAWDHINVFPTNELYEKQFADLIECHQKGGLIYYVGDEVLDRMVNSQFKPSVFVKPYDTPQYKMNDGITTVCHEEISCDLEIIGEHNLQNMEGARLLCEEIGIKAAQFYNAMQDFSGAGRRLELQYKSDGLVIYKDFAHSPSKVTASVKAIKNQYPTMLAVAFLELHTFSSLNKDFLPNYKHSLDAAGEAVIYLNPETLAKKGDLKITEEEIHHAFGRSDIQLIESPEELKDYLIRRAKSNQVVICMSSGNWGGVAIQELLKGEE